MLLVIVIVVAILAVLSLVFFAAHRLKAAIRFRLGWGRGVMSLDVEAPHRRLPAAHDHEE